jgi:hypothetical protein
MIYNKTDAGREAIKSRSNLLSPKQRSGLILINGERTLDEFLKMVEGIGFTMTDVAYLEEHGLIAALTGSTTAVPKLVDIVLDEPLGGYIDIDAAQSRYKQAYPVATQLTASMGLRGFRLNLAVEAAGSYSQLIQLFPKIQESVGTAKAKVLEDALRGA